MTLQPGKYITICHECDLKVSIDSLKFGQKAQCVRCGYTITRKPHNALTRMMTFSATAVIALFFSNTFNFVTLGAQGSEVKLTLLQSIHALFVQGNSVLALTILMVIIVLPVIFLSVLGLLLLTIEPQTVTARSIALLRIVNVFRFWNMTEIYFLGVLVSLIKLVSLANISLGPSFWFFALFCLAQIAVLLHIDTFQLGHQIRILVKQQSENTEGQSYPLSDNELSCHHCARLQSTNNRRCDFCGTKLHYRKVNSLQRSWIFLMTGILLYIPANALPIMVTSTLGRSESTTIVEGVLLLMEHGSYPIALVIFIASVVVPMGKFLILLALILSAQYRLFNRPQEKIIAYRVTEYIGRWSMVDVFVVAFLAGLIQLGNVMTIYPGPAVLAFAGMVIATMLAAASFEPKLFWDHYEQ